MDESHLKNFLKDPKVRTIFDIKKNQKCETVICFIKAVVFVCFLCFYLKDMLIMIFPSE